MYISPEKMQRLADKPFEGYWNLEPSLEELLSDPIVMAMTEADGVGRHELETRMRRAAALLRFRGGSVTAPLRAFSPSGTLGELYISLLQAIARSFGNAEKRLDIIASHRRLARTTTRRRAQKW